MEDKSSMVLQLQGFRPRLKHEYGDGYVLSITLTDVLPPAMISELLKDMQKGYIKITLEK